MNYGIPYQGSKNVIAEWVVSWLPPSHTLVDLFAGGCAVTHAALLSGRFGRIVANDRSDAPQVFLDAANGEFEGYCTVPTRGEFYAAKDDDTALALLYSFGNDGNSYLWGERIEDVKLHASRMVSMPSMQERREEYRKFCRALARYLAENGERGLENLGKSNGVMELGGLEGLQRLEGLEGLQRLQGLEGLQRLQGLERLQDLQELGGLDGQETLHITRLDYRDVEVPDGATVYADPPYASTLHDKKQYGGGFDYGHFEEWLAAAPFPVVVSEYDCPAGCVEIASREKTVRMNNKVCGRATERLFVQERMLGEYERRMHETGLFAAEETR